MSRIGLVVNPTSGKGRGATAGARTRERLAAAGHVVADLSGSSLLDAMHHARQGVIDGLDALVVVGGDGIVHLGFNAVATTTVPLGIVAVGSGNDFARAVGLPRHKVDVAVDVLLDALGQGRHRAVDAAHVSAPGRLDGRWYAGVLSAGLDAAVNDRANRLTFPRGHLKYMRALLGELGAFQPFGYRVTMGERVWDSAGTLVAIANGPAFGGGLKIAPHAQVDDGQLDVVLAGPFSRWGAVRILPRLYPGTHVRDDRVEVVRATEVLLEPTTAGLEPPVAMADGESIGRLPLHVDLHPRAVRLLV